MRIFFVLFLWIAMIGGLTLYMHDRDAHAPVAATAVKLSAAEGKYSVEVTPTFSAEPDPFALVSDRDAAAALTVTLRGREILARNDDVRPGVPILVDDIEGLVAGDNELLLEASPPNSEADQRHFVQLRVLKDGLPAAEETFWSEGGATVSGTLHFSLRETEGDANAH